VQRPRCGTSRGRWRRNDERRLQFRGLYGLLCHIPCLFLWLWCLASYVEEEGGGTMSAKRRRETARIVKRRAKLRELYGYDSFVSLSRGKNMPIGILRKRTAWMCGKWKEPKYGGRFWEKYILDELTKEAGTMSEKPRKCPKCNRCGFGWLFYGECKFCGYKHKWTKEDKEGNKNG
jgi:hypothetical protein